MNLRIVIVEDEFQIRHGMIHTLAWSEHGCQVVGEAADGVAGCEVIDRLRPDIVISDIKMPRMNGLEMIEKTIGVCGYAAVLLTGYSEFEYARKACRIGVCEYLLKPVDEDELFSVIEMIRTKRASPAGSADRQDELIYFDHEHVSPMVLRAVAYIEHHYNERFSQNDLAVKLNMGTSTLTSAFKEETGYTLHEYITRYRMVRAVQMLKKREMRIYEIGRAVGIPNYRYFCGIFRKYFSCAPSDYQKRS